MGVGKRGAGFWQLLDRVGQAWPVYSRSIFEVIYIIFIASNLTPSFSYTDVICSFFTGLLEMINFRGARGDTKFS